MDPMLQLAKRFLATELSFERQAWANINQEIEDAILGKQKNGIQGQVKREETVEDKLRLLLWKSRDERAQEILADVLYRHSHIAHKLCEHKPDLCPEFVHYIADEARKQWRVEKNGNGWLPNRIPELRIPELLKEHKFDINKKFPEALELSLIDEPELMQTLADHLKAALPFSLVLNKELHEIRLSRQCRLREDRDATAARAMKDILRRFTIRDRRLNGTQGTQRDPDEDPVKKKIEEQLKQLQQCEKHKEPLKCQGQRKKPVLARYPPAEAEAMSLFGLALSGGGIRSATFNLGVLQGMADLDLLRRLDYLSGVSGGSHIAGWLAAWTKRAHDGVRKVQRWLSPTRSPIPDTQETQPIHFLRRFSNYLAPRKGLLSADTWAMVSAWLRNTMLNQLVFVLFIGALLGIPRLIFRIFNHEIWFRAHDKGWIGAFAIALLFLLAALIGLNLGRFDHDPRPGRGDRRRPSWLWEGLGVHSTVVSGFLVLGLVGSSELFWLAAPPVEQPPWGGTYIVIVGAMLLAQLCGRSWRCFYNERAEDTTPREKIWAFFWLGVSSAASSFLAWAMLYGGFQYFLRHAPWLPMLDKQSILNKSLAATLVLGPAAVIGVLSLGIIFQLGFMGHNLPDSRREWWSRLGAKLALTSGLWMALSFSALFGPWAVLWLKEWSSTAGVVLIACLVVLWAAMTILGFQWGLSSRTAPFPAGDSGSISRFGPLSWKLRAWIGQSAPYVYIAGLAIGLPFCQYVLTTGYPVPSPGDYWNNLDLALGPLWLPFALLTLALFFAWRFDVNEFSMRHLYGNRLVRCYLGASRAGRASGARNPNPFTGFDPHDDLDLADLSVQPPAPYDLARAGGPYWGAFPIINAALNLVAGKELAWQERKAASFAFTPLYSGYECVSADTQPKRELANYGYRPTVDYARPRLHGLSLGTCMAISGAAVNPNMGYHSSPALSFLMALFNVRLGCWLGNTRHRKTWRKSSPGLGLIYLINELIGRTDDTSRYINLSDGGHFENLGLYELVRRRCKYIIVSDAEEDAAFSFNGLGNAIRKCRTDFGVDIRMNPDQLRPVHEGGKDQGRSRTHCAVGDLIYSPETRGKLLYIKTTLTGDEPGDVLEYKLRHPDFPHQSTVNQFFDESQFESYRELGQHIAVVILMRAVQSIEPKPSRPEPKPRGAGDADQQDKALHVPGSQGNASSEEDTKDQDQFLGQLFRYLHAMWYPRTREMATAGDKHSKEYDALVEKFRDPRLIAPGSTFFRQKDWKPEPAFFIHSRMIELMHRVFQDLELETMAEHPHNEGWMSMFRDWAEDDSFKITWKVVRENYEIRFRNFCEKEFFLWDGGHPDGRRTQEADTGTRL